VTGLAAQLPQPVRLAELAAAIGGEIVGDGEQIITSISSLAEAGPGSITFLANPRYAPMLAESQAAAVLLAAADEANPHLNQVVVANPDFAFAQVVELFGPQQPRMPIGVHPTAVIGDGVEIGKDCSIGAYAVIEAGASIGSGCVIYPHAYVGFQSIIGEKSIIYPHATVREQCQLGKRVILHSGAVVGSDGFGYATVQGVHHKIPQIGNVVVGDDVEIGANTTIDRARFGVTTIGAGTKMDNLAQIAHNVTMGQGCIIVAQSGVAGSTELGNYVTIAGQSGISGHIKIGDMATVAARSGVTKNVPPKMVVIGTPAQEFRSFQEREVSIRRAKKSQETVQELVNRVAALEAQLAEHQAGNGQES
jgi:UDP-3-O-[3-hydroxymyristoyl] glucosamine N-acyltransferase